MLHYDFLTHKDVFDLEYFERYLCRKTVHSDRILYWFVRRPCEEFKDNVSFTIEVSECENGFEVSTPCFKRCVLTNNSDVVNKIKTTIDTYLEQKQNV